MKIKQHLLKFWNFWPPFFGAGIKVKSVDSQWRQMVIELKLRPWTSNYVGTQFGGSMFAMTDAFYMVMLLRNLGREYIVWDKSATIRYLKPGRTHLRAIFHLSEDDIMQIKEVLKTQKKMDWTRKVEIKDLNGEVVAEVDKVVYIRKKDDAPSSPQN